VAASYRTPRAQRLVRETAARAAHKPGAGEEEEYVVCGELTALHAAARTGVVALLEFLLQVGCRWGLGVGPGGWWLVARGVESARLQRAGQRRGPALPGAGRLSRASALGLRPEA
jgi:hypothetical protein